MSDHPSAVLAAAEGVGAEIAWVVISVLCWILMIAPFALWWAGVRTPRAERRAAGGRGGFYECDWVHGKQRGARVHQFQS